MSEHASSAGEETTSSLKMSDRIYLHIYDYETKEFSGLTTYHGLVRIYNSNTWPSRIFWCVVVLSCLSLFMIHSGYLLLGYHSKPTLFQVNTMLPPDGMLFPDITICNYNLIVPSKLKGWNISTELVDYVLEHYAEHVASSDADLLRKEAAMAEYEKQYNESTGRSFQVREFLNKVGPSCEDMILSCSYEGIYEGDCCRYAKPVQTDIGQCIRFSSRHLQRKQYLSGSSYGWQFTVNGRNEEKIFNPPHQFSSHGIRVVLSEAGKEISFRSNGVSSPPGAAIHAGIDTKNVSLLRRTDWGVCQRNWDPLIHGDVLIPWNYTASHCEWNCLAKEYLEISHCLPVYMYWNTQYPACTPIQIKKFNQARKATPRPSCVCDVECESMEYGIQMSYSDLTRRNVPARLNLTEQYIEDSISVVWLYFRSISFERHEQQKQLQTADLLSNIAGSMGLFLGMSTVTLLEIFIYLFKSVWGTVNTERQNQFMQAMIEEEEERRQSLVIVEEPIEEPIEEPGTNTSARRASRRVSIMPLHIHRRVSVRRDSTMLDAGSLLPHRRSISVAPQSFMHRQSIAAGMMGKRGSFFESSGEILPGRRGSTVPQQPQQHRMSLAVPNQPSGRRLSVQHTDDAIHLSFVNHGTRRKSSVRPMNSLL